MSGVPSFGRYIAPVLMDPGDYIASDVAAQAPDPLRELVLIAHELGHHYLVLRGTGSGIFDEAKPTQTYEEEVGAWTIGRALLLARNFQEWPYFDLDESVAVAGYREGLHLANTASIEERVRRTLTGN